MEPFVGVSRETWRKLCRTGKAPRPIRLSPRCTVWSNDQMHAYLADPLGYRVP
ncbi:transcriptional regulator [Burkholderia cepacia]|nr:transcriptional regulator [Burkholderia cepacia]